MPFQELALEIRSVVEAPHFEKGALHPLDQILDRSLLIAEARSAQLRRDAVVDGHLRKGRVPLDLGADVPQNNDLRIVEDRDERNALEFFVAGQEGADQRLDLLVGDGHDVAPSGPLEPGGEELDPLHLSG